MKLNVTFKTKQAIDLEAHPPGEELAQRIAATLRAKGIDVGEIDNHNDFAWSIDCQLGGHKPWLLVGYVNDDPYDWLALVNSGYGFVASKLLRKSDLPARERLAVVLNEALAQDTEVHDVRWHQGEFGDGWSATPSG